MAVDPRRPITAAGLLSRLVQSLYANTAKWYASLTDGNLPSSHILVGGLYQTTPQTLTTEQTGPFQIDATGNLKVTLVAGTAVVGHVITDTGSTTAVTGNVTVVQPTGTNLHVVVDSGTITTVSTVTAVTTVSTVTAVTAITNALPAGTNNIGGVTPQPLSTGGLSTKSFVSANSNNKASVGAPCRIYSIEIFNIQSVPVYLKCFNAASGSVSAGTTACDFQFACPANSTAANGAGTNIQLDPGIGMATDFTYLLTTGIGTTDNTSVAANSQIVTIGYK